MLLWRHGHDSRCVSGGEGAHQCVCVCVCARVCVCLCVCASPSPVSSSSSSQSVSQPLLRESTLGNSSLEFPWIRSRPPLPSLLPLSPTVLPSLSPPHPPCFPFFPLTFSLWSDMGCVCVCVCVCVCEDMLVYSQQPVQYDCWFICPLHSGPSPFLQHHPSSEHRCRTVYPLTPVGSISPFTKKKKNSNWSGVSACFLSISTHVLWLIFSSSPVPKMRTAFQKQFVAICGSGRAQSEPHHRHDRHHHSNKMLGNVWWNTQSVYLVGGLSRWALSEILYFQRDLQ